MSSAFFVQTKSCGFCVVVLDVVVDSVFEFGDAAEYASTDVFADDFREVKAIAVLD